MIDVREATGRDVAAIREIFLASYGTNYTDPRYYDEALLTRGVGIKFDGQEKTNVEEYCVSEGWIRVAVGKTVDRKGNPLTTKLAGKVEPYFEK